MKVKFVATTRINRKDLPKVVRTLKQIERDHGVLTPSIVVSEAESPRSALHKYFEWSDAAAAIRHREWQARLLIGAVQVQFIDSGGKTQSCRAFVNIVPTEEETSDTIGNQGYISVSRSQKSGAYQLQVLEYARTQLLIWRKKFGSFKEFYEVASAIDKLK